MVVEDDRDRVDRDPTVYQIGDIPKPDCKYEANQMDHREPLFRFLTRVFLRS